MGQRSVRVIQTLPHAAVTVRLTPQPHQRTSDLVARMQPGRAGRWYVTVQTASRIAPGVKRWAIVARPGHQSIQANGIIRIVSTGGSTASRARALYRFAGQLAGALYPRLSATMDLDNDLLKAEQAHRQTGEIAAMTRQSQRAILSCARASRAVSRIHLPAPLRSSRDVQDIVRAAQSTTYHAGDLGRFVHASVKRYADVTTATSRRHIDRDLAPWLSGLQQIGAILSGLERPWHL